MSEENNDSTEAEKPAPKKAAAKKPAARKPAAKKPAAKKTAAAKTTSSKTTSGAKKAPARKAAPKKAAPAKKTEVSEEAPEVTPDSKPEETQMNTENTADDAGFEEPKPRTDEGKASGTWQDSKLFEELKQRDWKAIATRGMFMLLYAIAGVVVMYLAVTLVAIQFVLSILTGAPNDQLRDGIVKLSEYLVSILKFLAYQTDDLPWPLEPDTKSEE